MRYAAIINQIANHLETEPSRVKRLILRETARNLRDASRHKEMATDNYNLTMIDHAKSLMSA